MGCQRLSIALGTFGVTEVCVAGTGVPYRKGGVRAAVESLEPAVAA